MRVLLGWKGWLLQELFLVVFGVKATPNVRRPNILKQKGGSSGKHIEKTGISGKHLNQILPPFDGMF